MYDAAAYFRNQLINLRPKHTIYSLGSCVCALCKCILFSFSFILMVTRCESIPLRCWLRYCPAIVCDNYFRENDSTVWSSQCARARAAPRDKQARRECKFTIIIQLRYSLQLQGYNLRVYRRFFFLLSLDTNMCS